MSLLRYWLSHLPPVRRSPHRRAEPGFTLIELLIAALISSIIVLALLSLVIELVSTNRREMARTETQRDMGIATEYMSSELREAAYVYPGDCLGGSVGTGPTDPTFCPGLFGSSLSTSGSTPVVPILAFWKLDPLPNCAGAECDQYRLAGRTYTLVVYFLEKRGTQTWEGQAQLSRADIARFRSDGSVRTPYFDPSAENTSFRTWPFQSQSGSLTKLMSQTFSQADRSVLVDFVDATPDQTSSNDQSMCPENYKVTPSSALLSRSGFANVRSVYACVRDDTANQDITSERTAFNQKVVLFVRGNPIGRYGLDAAACGQSLQSTLRKDDNPCKLAAVKTEVLNRGVANKVPKPL